MAGWHFLPHIDRSSEKWNRNSLMRVSRTLLILTRVVNICHSTATLSDASASRRETIEAFRHVMNAKTDKTPALPPAPAQNMGPPVTGLRRLIVAELLAGDREVILEHDGQDYRLRITANGKLILTK